MLSEYAWVKVAHRFGPHMLDLMSLDSNVQKDAAGILLRHFTTHSTLFSVGINVFAQAVSSEDIYIFASFVVVGPLLRFLEAANISSTIKVPQLYPLPFWWLIPGSRASSCIQLGHQRRPQHAPFSVFQKLFYSTPLQRDLFAFTVNICWFAHFCIRLQLDIFIFIDSTPPYLETYNALSALCLLKWWVFQLLPAMRLQERFTKICFFSPLR